ncbi:cysteine desulfurase family protein [Sphingobacterium psychroaquaticum]|uniref:cysteine desulfurase family protein n=1 Tax=Sphingobacterium psychroaquaticum TaxID=561061 RepID=UPI001F0FB5E2|nr:cysteine desulfurase family protein [Sphingobacterium psychroaquaticum]
MELIYLDNNATTKIDDQVFEAMLPFLRESYGNASSIQHQLGRASQTAVEHARSQVATCLGATEKEIIFTSGATESINMVLRGITSAYKGKGNHIITCKTEHKAVLTTCRLLEKKGVKITYLPVNDQGEIDLDNLKSAIQSDTILVCLMAANNETGVLHPISDIAKICQERDTLFFCDATQLIGKSEINLTKIPIDILALSGHKIHGPKGVGALYIRRKRKPIQVPALISGGGQENDLRGGTLHVSGIVGLGKAMEIASFPPHISHYRDYLEQQLLDHIPAIIIHGSAAPRLGNTSSITFRHIKASEIMVAMPQLALSAGSACSAGLRDPSHVLKAMHLHDEDAFSTIRISLSRYTTKQEIEKTAQLLIQVVAQLRANSPIWQLYEQGLIT